MGNVIFWICFLALIGAIAVSAIVRSFEMKEGRRRKILDEYESDPDTCFTKEGFCEGSGMLKYLSSINPDDYVLDGITVSDLLLSELYSRMNRCITGAGSEYLNCRFRMMFAERVNVSGIENEIEGFIKDPQKSHRARCILDICPPANDTDAFVLISDLEKAEKLNMASDIVPVGLLLISVCIMPFFLLFGTIAAIISLVVCIGTYFSGKSKMEDDLKGLSICLKYLRCGSRLSDSGFEAFERYKAIFALSRASFLIPYKDGTSSNPLSIIFDYVRMITHIDLIAYKIRIAGITANIEEIKKLYIDIGKIDALIATASYLAQKKHCAARISDENRLKATGLYHPLLKDAVGNDVDTERGMLITGSNASGKSTFLKAVGISILFAQSFGITFADSFESRKFKLFTSMALSDNLLGGESYYVVEARSIKRICDAAKEGGCLCIIDEVLRGTNTVERIAASTMILRSLLKDDVLLFAATHDLELVGMLRDNIDSYFFTEEIKENEVVFPYVLHEGTTNRTNAIRLLSVLKFDDEVVSGSNELVERYRKSGKWEMTS